MRQTYICIYKKIYKFIYFKNSFVSIYGLLEKKCFLPSAKTWIDGSTMMESLFDLLLQKNNRWQHQNSALCGFFFFQYNKNTFSIKIMKISGLKHFTNYLRLAKKKFLNNVIKFERRLK